MFCYVKGIWQGANMILGPALNLHRAAAIGYLEAESKFADALWWPQCRVSLW